MPHSTTASIDTFDLVVEEHRPTFLDDGDEEERPMTSKSQSSSAYGVAVTSQTPTRDERSDLPSQRSSVISARRKSAPGTNTTYADVMAQGGPVQEGTIIRRGADKDNRRSLTFSEDSKRRSQHFENGAVGMTREKVQRHSPVVAELKTNVIIKDEFTLVTDLSQHLAQRYQRNLSCIMIKVDHSSCLALGGNFEPCYILSIQTVPSQMSASTNKRNAALIQNFMADILSVPSERGIVTFVPIQEENLAQNGHTVYGEMEKAEKSEVKRVAEAHRKSMTMSPNGNPVVNGLPKTNGILVAASDSSNSVTPEPQSTPGAKGATALRDRASSANSKNGRPSTAHGTSSHSAFDGLRMNPVSIESLKSEASKTPNGRPKTFGAPEPASVQEELKREPLPQPARSASSQSVPLVSKATSTPATEPKSVKSEPKKSSSVSSTTKYSTTPTSQSPLAPRPVQNVPKSTTNSVTAPVIAPSSTRAKHTPLIPEKRTKNTYLDGVSSLTSRDSGKAASPPSPTIVVTSSDEIPLKANTAKRRSTITATPKLPAYPSPPPEPVETKSMSSRLSKRKSFLRMFKRNSIPAWYEQ